MGASDAQSCVDASLLATGSSRREKLCLVKLTKLIICLLLCTLQAGAIVLLFPTATMRTPRPSLETKRAKSNSIHHSAADGTDKSTDDQPTNSSKPPMWFVWLGSNPLRGLHRAAIESCRKHNQESFDIRIVRDQDLTDSSTYLGFDLHPMFHLLDHVQKSDYLRQELLHYHGGIYLDADVFCLQSLAHTLDMVRSDGNKPIGGGSPGEGTFNNNMLGPFVKHSSYTTATHQELWSVMDQLRPTLLQCAKDHPNGMGGIEYPRQIKHNFQLCGTSWGVLIDFNKGRTREAYESGWLAKTFERCSPRSTLGSCDLLHLGCANSGRDCDDPDSMCPQYPILRGAGLWSC